jgi:hypothetical protein
MLPRITFLITPATSHLPFTILRRQFPLIPAYSYTVHRAQGTTLELLGLYFNGDAFCHGLLFTALSRVRGGWGQIAVFVAPGCEGLGNSVCQHVLRCLM